MDGSRRGDKTNLQGRGRKQGRDDANPEDYQPGGSSSRGQRSFDVVRSQDISRESVIPNALKNNNLFWVPSYSGGVGLNREAVDRYLSGDPGYWESSLGRSRDISNTREGTPHNASNDSTQDSVLQHDTNRSGLLSVGEYGMNRITDHLQRRGVLCGNDTLGKSKGEGLESNTSQEDHPSSLLFDPVREAASWNLTQSRGDNTQQKVSDSSSMRRAMSQSADDSSEEYDPTTIESLSETARWYETQEKILIQYKCFNELKDRKDIYSELSDLKFHLGIYENNCRKLVHANEKEGEISRIANTREQIRFIVGDSEKYKNNSYVSKSNIVNDFLNFRIEKAYNGTEEKINEIMQSLNSKLQQAISNKINKI